MKNMAKTGVMLLIFLAALCTVVSAMLGNSSMLHQRIKNVVPRGLNCLIHVTADDRRIPDLAKEHQVLSGPHAVSRIDKSAPCFVAVIWLKKDTDSWSDYDCHTNEYQGRHTSANENINLDKTNLPTQTP